MTERIPATCTGARPALLLLLGVFVAGPSGMAAQDVEERFPGVSLGLMYETRPMPTLAIQPFVAEQAGLGFAGQVENIIARDLRYSNRFNVMSELPASLVREEVDYALWDQLGATWLVTGRIEGSGSGAVLVLQLHDVVYRQMTQSGRFPLRTPDALDFRMAVHIASDAVVQWAFGEPGIAATRIAFSRRMDDGSQDLWVVDSDGENLRRLTRHQGTEFGRPISLSPSWSPDGTRLIYTSYKDEGMPRLYEINLETGAERVVPVPREGDYITPVYHPDGERIFFSINAGNRSGIYSYNLARDCCFTSLWEGRSEDISPSFSADGNRMVFNSNRLGVGTPQIYTTTLASTARPELVSPYVYDRPGYYTSPDWSPVGNRVIFHGRVAQRGAHQLLLADLDRGGPLVQLTFDGVNEDPSWAPDGRHLVYVGARPWGYGLFVTDSVTGNTRTLVSGIRPNLPAWSPPLPLR
jgi:TolB protein